MRPTDEQQAVIDACADGSNTVVQAAAGAGKTSTLREAATAMPRQRILYIVYNKAAQKDAERSFPKNVECRTIHSLAHRAIAQTFDLRERIYGNGNRIPSSLSAARLGITSPVNIGADLHLTPSSIASLATQTVRRFCQSSAQEITDQCLPMVRGIPTSWRLTQLKSEADQLKRAGNLQLAEQAHNDWDSGLRARAELARLVLPIARDAWADLTNPNGNKVRFEEDCYLKMWQLTAPTLPYDVVMLDEAQDSNPVTVDIVTRQGNAQQVAIGDGCQQLYEWRGAVDALDDWPADVRLYLTQSWRFGPAIADEANKWLRLLDTGLVVRGTAAIHSRVTTDPDTAPDAVLCRYNAGAISQVIQALDAGRRPSLAGRIRQALPPLIRGAVHLQDGRPADHPDLALFSSWREVQEYSETPEGVDMRTFVRLIDKHGCEPLLAVLDRTVSEDKSDLVISTAHAAKGREWERVRIHNDYPVPDENEDGELAAPSPSECRLAYVAVTRARVTLDRTGLAWADQVAAPVHQPRTHQSTSARQPEPAAMAPVDAPAVPGRPLDTWRVCGQRVTDRPGSGCTCGPTDPTRLRANDALARIEGVTR